MVGSYPENCQREEFKMLTPEIVAENIKKIKYVDENFKENVIESFGYIGEDDDITIKPAYELRNGVESTIGYWCTADEDDPDSDFARSDILVRVKDNYIIDVDVVYDNGYSTL